MKTCKGRRLFAVAGLGAAVLASSLSPSMVLAQTSWPTKPVTMVIAFPPGGPTDTDTRMFTQKLKDSFQQTFLIDNRPGAGGTIGTGYVAKSVPDGHTLLVATIGFTVAPTLYKDLPYHPITDFTPISMVTKRAAMMVVNVDLPIRTVPEWIAYARANPGKLNFGTPGQGGGPHLAGELLSSLTHTKVTFVHYKATPPMALDMVSGRLDMGITIPAGICAHVKSGKLRLLGTTGSERTRLMPDVPSVSEFVPGFEYSSWLGFVAPKGVPPTVVIRLSAEIIRLSKTPEIFKKLSDDGNDLASSTTPEQFRDFLAADYGRWRKVVQESNIKLEE